MGLNFVAATDFERCFAGLRECLSGGRSFVPQGPGSRSVAAAELAGVAAELTHGHVFLKTSGSTGTPKVVVLSAAALRAAATASDTVLGGPGAWFVALPLHLVSGLQQLARCVGAGVRPGFYSGRFTAAEFVRQVDVWFAQRATGADAGEASRKYVSLVPAQLHDLFEYGGEEPAALRVLRGFDAVLVGGQAVSLELRQQAYSFGVPLRLSYGATETCGGCVYDGVPLPGVRARIREGCVQLAGAQLASGYLCGDDVGGVLRLADSWREDVGQASFFVEDGVRWYRTGDLGSMLGGMLRLRGRADRVFISGGVNVSLDELERVLCGLCPGVEFAAVAFCDERWGQRAHVAYACVGDAPVWEGVFADVREVLGVAAVPVSVTRFARLPRLAGGKLDSVLVGKRLAAASLEGSCGETAG